MEDVAQHEDAADAEANPELLAAEAEADSFVEVEGEEGGGEGEAEGQI